MAIGAGTSLLAFLSGGAQKGNQIIDEGRAAKTRQIERRQQALLQRKNNVAETKYASQVKAHVSQEERYNKWSSSDLKSNKLTQREFFKEKGFDDSQIPKLLGTAEAQSMIDGALVRPGDFPSMSFSDFEPEDESASNSDNLRDFFGFSSKVTARMEPLIKGGRGAASVRGDDIQEKITKQPSENNLTNKSSKLPSVDIEDLLKTDTFSTESKDAVVRLTAQIENVEEDMKGTEDPDRLAILNRRRELLKLDLEQETKITGQTPTDEAIANRMPRAIEAVSNRIGNAEKALQSLDQLNKLTVSGVTGAAGGITSFKSALSNTLRGLSELTGFVNPKSREQQIDEIQASGFSLDDLDNANFAVLQGMQRGQKIDLIYAVASTFKEDGRKNVNNVDLENAAKLLGSGAGKLEAGLMVSLEKGISRRLAGAHKQGYLLEGVSPREKKRFGLGWVNAQRTLHPEWFKNKDGSEKYDMEAMVKVDEKGQVFLAGPDNSAILLEDFFNRIQ